MSVVILAEGLSKEYRIGAPRAPYETLRESLTRALAAPFRRGPDAPGARRGAAAALIRAPRRLPLGRRPGGALGGTGRDGARDRTLVMYRARVSVAGRRL